MLVGGNAPNRLGRIDQQSHRDRQRRPRVRDSRVPILDARVQPMFHPSVAVVALALAVACRPAAAQPPAEAAPPAVAFEGFGLGDLSAAASVARVLRETAGTESPPGGVPLDVMVRGPGGGRGAPGPLAAELRSRIDGIDVAAGLEGDAKDIVGRTPSWIGRIGVGSERPAGLEAIELRTRLESRGGAHRLGVEIGPRIERRLPRGARVFLDGSASAEAVRAGDAGGWQLPGTSTADSATAVGVSARTGIVR